MLLSVSLLSNVKGYKARKAANWSTNACSPRPEIPYACVWERRPQRWFQCRRWWCAWTAPQNSASLSADTTATAADGWVTPKTQTPGSTGDTSPVGAEIICYLVQIVCRSCSRNRYPLKYMKDRMAKVCDHCYNELRKRGELCFYSMSAATPLCRPSSGLCSYVYVADAPTLSSQSSPRPHRSSRPLSAVFQNIHPPNIWRHRKGIVTFTQVRVQQQKMAAGEDGSRLRWPLLLLQVTVSEEGSISGSLQRSKKSKRSWKRLWFLLKDKVLYTYRAQEVRRHQHGVAMQTKPDL